MQNEIISFSKDHTTRAITEDGKLYVDTQFHDAHSLEVNKRIRNSRMLEKMKLGLHDNEDVRAVLSVPSAILWLTFQKNHPDIYAMLKSRDESERIKALKRIQLIEPNWVLMERF